MMNGIAHGGGGNCRGQPAQEPLTASIATSPRFTRPSMRILLTGASGFIGRRLLEALHCRGYAVVASSRYALVTNIQSAVTELMAPFRGECSSWGVLCDPPDHHEHSSCQCGNDQTLTNSGAKKGYECKTHL
jgi:hypothetical protein